MCLVPYTSARDGLAITFRILLFLNNTLVAQLLLEVAWVHLLWRNQSVMKIYPFICQCSLLWCRRYK